MLSLSGPRHWSLPVGYLNTWNLADSARRLHPVCLGDCRVWSQAVRRSSVAMGIPSNNASFCVCWCIRITQEMSSEIQAKSSYVQAANTKGIFGYVKIHRLVVLILDRKRTRGTRDDWGKLDETGARLKTYQRKTLVRLGQNGHDRIVNTNCNKVLHLHPAKQLWFTILM